VYESSDVIAFLQTCQNDRLKKNVEDMLQSLLDNCLLGIKVPKVQIPRSYVRKFGHKHNLYLLDLVDGWRMTYLLSSCTIHPLGIRVDAVEVLSHKEYERRFGY
jgi:hypothetical protein